MADEKELIEWLTILNGSASYFREPDLGNKITAIAVEHTGEIFSQLKLL